LICAHMSVSPGVRHMPFAALFAKVVHLNRSFTVDFLARMLNCLKSFDTFYFFAMFSSSSLAGTSRGFSFCALYTLSSKETLPPSFAIVFYTVSSALSLVAKCELDMFAITSNVSCQPMSFRSSLVCWMQISNVSRSRHTAVRSACKNYYCQGANVSARVDGFEKNASQSTGRPSPQLVNFCLE